MWNQPSRMVLLAIACAFLLPGQLRAQNDAAPEKEAAQPAKAEGAVPDLPGPPQVTKVKLLPDLHTVPVAQGGPQYNVHMVDASLLPRDRQGIWVLNFSFKPLRLITIENKGRKTVHYLYYKVVNRTGQPITFAPQFTLVTDTGKRYEDAVIPDAVKRIQSREDPTIPLLGAVDIMGVIPPSKKNGVDDAVYGVAVWDNIDPKADLLSIYVRGLSDGYQMIQPPGGGKPVAKYKTLRIDFIRRGDERRLHEKEIQLNEPPYEWVYW